MTTLYAKAAGGNWSAAGTWSNVSSAGVDSSGPPTASDDVVFNAGSGNVSINATAVCRSLDCNGYVGTLTHGAFTLGIGDGTAGAGNIALRFSSGMTYTRSSPGVTSFLSSSATQQTIATNGKTVQAWTFNGTGSWLLSDNLTLAGSLTLTKGTLNTNGKTVSGTTFASTGSNTRVLTLGASSLTFSSNTWNVTSTGLTLNANTSSITCSGSGFSFTGGSFTYYDVSFTGAGTVTVAGTNSFHNLTRTGTAATANILLLPQSITQTVSNLFTATGANATTQRLIVQSTFAGIAGGISAGSVSLTNVDFVDFTGSGSASPFTGTSISCLDGGNVNNVTQTTPVTRYWVGGTGSWSNTNKWSTSSNGAGGASVPLPQDTAIIDGSSGGGTITYDMQRGAAPTFTGIAATTLTISTTVSWWSTTGITFHSNLTLSGAGTLNVGGRTASIKTWVTANKTIPWAVSFNMNGIICDYWLNGDLIISNKLTFTGGVITTNGYNITCTSFTVSSTTNAFRTANFGTSTITLTGTGTVLSFTAPTNFANTGRYKYLITDTSATQKTISLFGFNDTMSGDIVITPGSGTINITAANTFGSTLNGMYFSTTPAVATTIVFIALNTFTLSSDLFFKGAPGFLCTVKSSATGVSYWGLTSANGRIVTNYLNVFDMSNQYGTDTPKVFVGDNSVRNGSLNNGIIFSQPTAAPMMGMV